jgi:hypothetical protein
MACQLRLGSGRLHCGRDSPAAHTSGSCPAAAACEAAHTAPSCTTAASMHCMPCSRPSCSSICVPNACAALLTAAVSCCAGAMPAAQHACGGPAICLHAWPPGPAAVCACASTGTLLPVPVGALPCRCRQERQPGCVNITQCAEGGGFLNVIDLSAAVAIHVQHE